MLFNHQVRSGADAVTKFTCADKGHWLGNSSYPKFTIIDTPGFGTTSGSLLHLFYIYLEFTMRWF